MSEFPWGAAFLGALLATFLVDSSFGQSVPRWIKTLLNAAWMLLLASLAIGLPLAYFNEARVALPNGGYAIRWQVPSVLLAVSGLAILCALAVGTLGVALIAFNFQWRTALSDLRDAAPLKVTTANWAGVGVGLVIVAVGAVLSWLGGPLIISADGVQGIVGGIGTGLIVAGLVKTLGSFKKKSG